MKFCQGSPMLPESVPREEHIAILDESMEYGSAILLESIRAVERTFSNRLGDLGLSLQSIAGAAGVSVDVVRQSEEKAQNIPLKELEKIAFVLGLDERLLAFDEHGSADRDLELLTI